MIGGHYGLHRHKFEQTPGDSEGQGSLECRSSWDRKEFDITWLLLLLSRFSRVRLCETPQTAEYQSSLSITNCRSFLKLMPIESVMPSNHLILCCPLLLTPPIFPSIMVFLNESVLHIRWPKYWHFSFSISPFIEHPGLISFRMDWLDLLAVQ